MATLKHCELEIRVPPGGAVGSLKLEMGKVWPDSVVLCCTLKLGCSAWHSILVIDLRSGEDWGASAGRLARVAAGQALSASYSHVEGATLSVRRKQHRYYIQLDDRAALKCYPLLIEWEEDMRLLVAWVIAVKDLLAPLVQRYRRGREQAAKEDERRAKSLRAAVERWQPRNAQQSL
jgi:hypothetical protein